MEMIKRCGPFAVCLVWLAGEWTGHAQPAGLRSCNMDAVAGLFVDADTQSLSVYAAPGWVSGDVVRTTVYRGVSSAR